MFYVTIDTKTELMATVDDWIVANLNVTGYYRVQYDDANYVKLLTKLDTNHNVSGFMVWKKTLLHLFSSQRGSPFI